MADAEERLRDLLKRVCQVFIKRKYGSAIAIVGQIHSAYPHMVEDQFLVFIQTISAERQASKDPNPLPQHESEKEVFKIFFETCSYPHTLRMKINYAILLKEKGISEHWVFDDLGEEFKRLQAAQGILFPSPVENVSSSSCPSSSSTQPIAPAQSLTPQTPEPQVLNPIGKTISSVYKITAIVGDHFDAEHYVSHEKVSLIYLKQRGHSERLCSSLNALRDEDDFKGRDSVVRPKTTVRGNQYSGRDKEGFLVTERLIPWTEYLSKIKKDFGNVSKTTWVNNFFHGEKIKKVLRGFNRGIIFLSLKGFVFSNFDDGLFVNEYGEGIVLPAVWDFIDSQNSVRQEILERRAVRDLKKTVETLIAGPFGSVEGFPDLCVELKTWLNFLNPNYLHNLPFAWLIDTPYLWSSKEKVAFFYKLQNLIRNRSYFSKTNLNNAMVEVQKLNDFNAWPNWVNLMESRIDNCIQSGNQPGFMIKLFNSKEYSSSADFVFWVYACYVHANDDMHCNYQEIRNVGLEKVRREREIYNTFPLMYTFLLESIRKAAQGLTITPKKIPYKAAGASKDYLKELVSLQVFLI